MRVAENNESLHCKADSGSRRLRDIEDRNRVEGKEARFIGPLIFYLYGVINLGSIRRILRFLAFKLEGGPIYSVTIRRIFSSYHGIEIGMYSGKSMFTPGNFKEGTKVGRYCSIYDSVRAFDANHPMNTKSTHAFFYNPDLGHIDRDILKRTRLTIGSDVWMGHNVILLPAVTSVGHGAVIGAGSVVHQDVPPYSVVVGNPARIIRYRFTPKKIKELLEEKWWEQSLDDHKRDLAHFHKPLEGGEEIR
ncbi:MAG: CatB-related O-acetyltransferase [Planctomycetes bacterium]|nr:CatB-related O-acetyltransferase [Planctomycetota bacterium]